MKNYLVTAVAVLAMCSCSKDEIVDLEQNALNTEATESRVSTTNGVTTLQSSSSSLFDIYDDPNYKWAFIQMNNWGLSVNPPDTGSDANQKITYRSIGNWFVNAYTKTGIHANEGYSGVKSYSSIVYGRHYGHTSKTNLLGKKISELRGNVPTNWSIDVTNDGGSNAVWNASYDIWFDATKLNSGLNKYEIMIWAAVKNQGPIAKYNAQGQPIAFRTGVQIGNEKFDVYMGSNGGNEVITFIRQNGRGKNKTSFSANLKDFMTYAKDTAKFMPNGMYCNSIQAGYEICTAGVSNNSKAKFATTAFGLRL